MILSFSILSYTFYILSLNSFSNHSLFKLLHNFIISFFGYLLICSTSVLNNIGIWSLKMSHAYNVVWSVILTSAVDNVQSIRLYEYIDLSFIIPVFLWQVHCSFTLCILTPKVLLNSSIFSPPASELFSQYHPLIWELRSPIIITFYFHRIPS